MRLFKKPWFLAILGLATLFWIVYSTAPILGFNADEVTNRPLTLATLLTSLVALILLVVWARLRWKSWRLQREIKEPLNPDSGPLGDLEKEFERAFDQLTTRTSADTIFGDSGAGRLPWMIIIGPPAAGKSTILEQSGLRFTQLGRKVKGVGGTKNCVWWLSEQGIFLDTAGRYSAQEESHGEWLGFLKLLRRYRRHRPIDGVLLQVSLYDLMRMSADEAEDLALTLQDRLHELQAELKLRFPVYLIFSQCDHIEGFEPFFQSLTPAEQQAPWGFALDLDSIRHQSLEQAFSERFQTLVNELSRRCSTQAHTITHRAQQERILCFPKEVEACGDALRQFTDVVFEKRRGRERPWLTSVFMVSARQGGILLSGFRQRAGDNIGGSATSGSSENSNQSYCVKGAFQWILAQALTAIRPTAAALRQSQLVAVALTLLLGLACTLISYRATTVAASERSWLGEVRRAVLDMQSVDPLPGQANRADHNQFLARLSTGYSLLNRLQEHERGGLTSRAHDLASSLLRDYVDRDLLQPLAEALSRNLEAGKRWRSDGVAGDDIELFGRGYLALKASFVLRREICPGADPEATRRWISSYLTDQWRQEIDDENIFRGEIPKYLSEQVLFLFQDTQRLSALQADVNLYQQARANLRGREPDAGTVFKLIVANSGLSIRESQLRTDQLQDGGIQRVYTYDGCPTFFDNASTGAEWWSCILDIAELPQQVDRQVVYSDNYKIAWNSWLTGVSLKTPSDSLDQLSRLLNSLSRAQDAELDQLLEVTGGTHALRALSSGTSIEGQLKDVPIHIGWWERIKRWALPAAKVVKTLTNEGHSQECEMARAQFSAFSDTLDQEKGGVRAGALTDYKIALRALLTSVDAMRLNSDREAKALELFHAALTDTTSVPRQVESARQALIESLGRGKGAVDPSALDLLLSRIESDLAKMVVPLASSALQIQWEQITNDAAWRVLKTIPDESKRCSDTLAYVNGPVKAFVTASINPLLVRQNLRECKTYPWNGHMLAIDPRWCRIIEQNLLIAARTQCPGAPPPPPPPAAAPSWNPMGGEHTSPFRVPPSNCPRKLDRFVVESPEGSWLCEVSTGKCQERDPKPRARLVIWLDGEGNAAGREVEAAPNLAALIARGNTTSRSSTFSFRKDICDDLSLSLLLTGGGGPPPPPAKPIGDGEWKQIQLPPQIGVERAR